jgi:hypothetical protein
MDEASRRSGVELLARGESLLIMDSKVDKLLSRARKLRDALPIVIRRCVDARDCRGCCPWANRRAVSFPE